MNRDTAKSTYKWALTKRTFEQVHQAKIQISLRIRAIWSESSLNVFWIAIGARFLHVDNEASGQTARMRRLIWVFVGRTAEGTFSHVDHVVFCVPCIKWKWVPWVKYIFSVDNLLLNLEYFPCVFYIKLWRISVDTLMHRSKMQVTLKALGGWVPWLWHANVPL